MIKKLIEVATTKCTRKNKFTKNKNEDQLHAKIHFDLSSKRVMPKFYPIILSESYR